MNKPGPPKRLKPFKHRRAHTRNAGRYEQRLKSCREKEQKLKMLELLIVEYEKQPNPDLEHIRDLKKRANEVRSQKRVLSTVQPRPRI